ncbi:MAG: hypothetical protein O2783_01275 [Chloroflexi bacterium]|nr:hypothetical protein [Chloroflexota bacterium]
MTRRLRWWTLLALPVFLLALVACETVATPTVIPTPTATPIPLLLPILVDPDDDPLGFFQSIPEEEQQCLTQSLGQARLDEILGGAGFARDDGLVMEQCISKETFARVILGLFVNQAGDLRDDTSACVWDVLSGVDLKRLFTSDDNEALVLALQTIIDASFCLTDEEIAMAAASAGIEEFPIAGLRCLAERVEVESLAAIFGDNPGMPSAEVVVAMLECGIGMLGPEGEFPQLAPEQLACLEAALDAEALAQFLSQGGDLPLESIAAMLECGLEMLGPEGVDGSGADGGIGVDISAEDLACIVEALGEEALAEIIAGERLPTFGEILALAACDLNLEELVGGS